MNQSVEVHFLAGRFEVFYVFQVTVDSAAEVRFLTHVVCAVTISVPQPKNFTFLSARRDI